MAFSFGFYNSLNHDRRYDAIQMSQIFDGIINDGVYATVGQSFIVKTTEIDNQVIVQSGRAWFDHTWNYNDTELPVTCEVADILLNRWDAIVIDIDSDETVRLNQILYVKGTAGTNPEKPVMANTATHHQYPLCYIYRKPNVNQINQEDITNTVGTSECPFVTGILQTITTDQLVQQWSDQWAQFVKNYEQSATDWGKAQKDSFEEYISEFKLQMSEFEQSSTDEFNEWFANLHYVLDGDVAGHLQNEIDELKEEGLSGSVITVSTLESTLIGKAVTLTGPETSKSGAFDEDGAVKFSGFMDVGNITIQSTDGTQTAVLHNTIPYFGNYKYSLAFWNATVNITTSSEDLHGQVITITDSNESVVTTTAFSSAGTATFNAIRPDTYTFSVTLDGETYSETLEVTEQTTYEIELDSKRFILTDWVTSSGSTKEYTTVEEVLSDERLVRRLMTRHASVDYLARNATVSNEDVIAIINNNFAAKWITRRKYALDRFNATAALKQLMESSGKYTGKWTLVGQVPVMTSDTTPSGVASAGTTRGSGYEAFRAFDDDSTTLWASNVTTANIEDWIQYKFENACKVATVKIRTTRYGGSVTAYLKVSGSNDGDTFIDLLNYASYEINDTTITLNVNSNKTYKYYRITGYLPATGSRLAFYSVQFYAGEVVDSLPTKDDTPDTIRYYETYGYKDNFEDLNAGTRITYLEDCDNANYTPMLTNEGTGTATAGDWADFLSLVLENKPGMFDKDGELVYWLNENDYTKKEDGSNSDYNNTSFNGGAFAWISKMYMRENYYSTYRTVEFASEDLEGFSPVGFIGPDDKLREGVLLPMGYMDANGRTLIAGTTPVASKTCDQEKAIIDAWATGTADGVFLGGAMLNFLRDLEYMLYKHTDIQLQGGHGRCNAGTQQVVANQVVANGNVKGFKGTSNKTTMNKAFHSQVLFSYQQWLRDPYTILISGSMRVSQHYKYDLSGNGYTNTGKTFSTSSSWFFPTKMQKASDEYGSTFVQSNTGSTSTGYCDGGYWNADGTRVALRLGYCNNDLVDGPAHLVLSGGASAADWDRGVGLMLLPPAGYKPEMAQ